MSDENRDSNSNDSLTSNITGMSRKPGEQNNLPWIILGVIILIVILGGVMFRDRLFPAKNTEQVAQQEEQKVSEYQAVFLANQQVYFGKLSNTNSEYVTMTDVYYLQVTQPPLQGSGQQNQQQSQPQVLLVKLGNELHGPKDEMHINRDQIYFYEDLKEDGRVVKAIREYQKNPPSANNEQKQQAPAQQPAPQQQTPAK